MTNPQPQPAAAVPRRSGWSYAYRDFPPCDCRRPDCTGRPESGLRITTGHTEAHPANAAAAPPAEPYRPAIGTLVLDVLNDRPGLLMDRDERTNAVFLRPVGGGCEWESDARWLARPVQPVREGL